ncbi:MAG: hypothetical protein LBC97_13075, partial [Bifidobacteriaceae bacterium]|nr:hypothetical protein [Bifidobacteriaceae bacterium]
MSGPKAYRLLVLSPSELARRDLMQTRARGLALRDRLLSQFAVLSGPPPMAVPPEPASDSIQDFQAWEAALQAANQQAEALIAGQRARRRLALVAGTAPAAIQFQASQSGQPPLFASSPPPGAAAQPPLNWPVAATPNAGRVPTSPHPRSPDAVPMPPLAGPVPTSPHPPSPHAVPMPPLAGPVPTSPHPPSPGAVPAPPDAPSAGHAVRVSRALELASQFEDQAAFEALAARAAPLAAAQPGAVSEADLLVLEAAVADQLKADSNRKALRAEANRQALRIAHLTSRDAEALRQAAASADTPAAVEAVRRQADQLLDQEARRADADYASSCVAEVLTELGYAVEAGPDAIGQAPLAPDARHVMLARRPD